MKEKDIKRKLSKLSLNEVFSLKRDVVVTSDNDFLITGTVNEQMPDEINLKFLFTEGASADFRIRLLLKYPRHLILKFVVEAEYGSRGTSSQLDMKALVLNNHSSVTFVPSLEINEKNVSIDHKSTIGMPDKELMKYLQSRGLSKNTSLEIIEQAFLQS
ncbi:SufD family Fe-S cluster assembly protein [Candidatus Dojkabacteria bacterium]|uniref:SufD family Fe-S cluster assembly protein n=1 Tax=Candidatus Dojkabacteria bacterium TaxID=2099670 RepID=A0A955HZ39_9BACT|nr:SufD family Fe-S cluster assembly protein [Candidatus Dojkabacteria bacterium]